ncbi:Bug family tripartite tricarboxylate transporter substrate binding protein [Enterovirga rhinocerotis]|uniref:Tripartite-type tricarboxylate transporter receptor subunit TctC n=1 Tax=Enterovirga rhinocerotis TaxID=1339210 RepID=A0A4R7BSE9_9HYPH|nr:tripartite tricarboxylate transporter substrate binding protein [Enterovirga rhinocerotis]TDR88193.1 tripartite-type tricarboxylate transporter receptor subunit TctC [Enterovirga rhinocerotis]
MSSRHSRRDLLAAGLAGSTALAMPAFVRAQDSWPTRPIELVVGFAAGGGTDTTARTVARYLERELGGQVIVANRPGASGELALNAISKAAPDGYLLGVTNYPGLLSLPIERNVGYKSDSFHYLANLVSDPSAFSVAADGPIKSIADLVAKAKAEPGKVTFGSTGVGTDEHLALSLFEQLGSLKLSHVPYRGAGPLGTDLLGRHIEAAGLNIGEAVPLGDKIKVIVQGGAKRSRFAPDAPTFREAGFPFEMRSERGIVAPKGLKPEIAKRLSDALAKVAANPDFVRQIESQYTELLYLPGETWEAHLKRENEVLSRLWKERPWSGN